jgi:carbon-monoxide dehydrogenase medium subunit
MKFLQPKTLAELSALLADQDDKIILAAGCTDILPKKLGKPWEAETIIDLTHIPALKEITFNLPTVLMAKEPSPSHHLFIGACCTHAQIAESEPVNRHFKALAQACAQIGSVQIRNRGTIGGNVANASPAADTVPCLMLFDAQTGYLGGTCITGFRLPLPEANTVSAFAKLGDRDVVTIARIDLAVKSVIKDGRLSGTRAVVGAAGEKPFFCEEAGAVLDGSCAEDALLEPFAAALAKAVEASIPGRSTLAYKRSAVRGPAAEILKKLQLELY